MEVDAEKTVTECMDGYYTGCICNFDQITGILTMHAQLCDDL